MNIDALVIVWATVGIAAKHGMNEFAVCDPDGYVIAFGQDIET